MEFKDKKAIYLQIAELLMDEILQGVYAEDERMPSVREYAGKVEVNVNTVVRTYEWLQQQEIIYTKRGLGYFVSPGAKERIKMLRHEAFLHESLPDIVRHMEALGIGIDELINELKKILK